MENTSYPVASEQSCARGHFRRDPRINRLIAGFTWGLGALVCALTIISWLRGGHITADGVITTLIVGIGTGLSGFLALAGEGDVVLLTGADEGQRRVIYGAIAPAFGVAFYGLCALWVGAQLLTPLRMHLETAVGALLVLVVIVYLGAYVRGR